MKYRADIDGLRAIAVLAVVTYHAFPQWLPGGFVGVDLFFVISGYLISGIIFNALERDRFTFHEFYARRIRRIFPALAIVLTAAYVAGWYLLFADRFAELGKHIAGGAGFISNFVLWREAGYFDGASDTKPLLHLWSLGVEEQFYLLWPVMAWIAWKRKWDLVAVTLTVFAVSMYFNLDRIRQDLIGTFYAPQTRFWELMAGAALAQVSMSTARGAVSRWTTDWYGAIVARSSARHALSALGAALVVVSVVVIDQSRHFPGRWAVLPVSAAVCLIASGPNAFVNRLLAWRPLVAVGLISYPLYLWHWPVLAMLRLVQGQTPSAALRGAAVLASVAAASATYLIVERPIRFGPRRAWVVPALCVAMAAIGAAGFHAYSADGLWSRAVNRSDKAAFSAYYDAMRRKGIVGPYRLECDFMELVTDRVKDSIPSRCTAPGRSGTWFLWGDSHAQALSPGVTALLPDGVSLAQVATSACRPGFDSIDADVPGGRCTRANAYAAEQLKLLQPAVLILAQQANHLSTDWDALAARARELGVARVVLIGPAPAWSPNLPEIFMTHYWQTRPEYVKEGLVSERMTLDAQLQARYGQSAALTYVSIQSRLCREDGCLARVPGIDPPELTSFDASHLTPAASRYVVDLALRPVLVQP